MKVFEKGNILSKIMIIGEAPGSRESEMGVPFVGRSGQLLDEIIDRIGLTYEDILFTNVIQKQPKFNATPSIDDVKKAIPRLREVIKRVEPDIIICMGSIAATAIKILLKEVPEKISVLAGTSSEVQTSYGKVTVIYTYHPAAALRSQERKKHLETTFAKYRPLFEKTVGRTLISKSK